MKIHAAGLSLVLLSGLPAWAAVPPSAINYQGVLRNASGAPENGSFDMVFRFYSLDTGGLLLLTDTHNSGAPSGQVVVTNGLFTAALGTGTLAAGSEPTLDAAFLHNGAVRLEVQVGAEPLSGSSCSKRERLSSWAAVDSGIRFCDQKEPPRHR